MALKTEIAAPWFRRANNWIVWRKKATWLCRGGTSTTAGFFPAILLPAGDHADEEQIFFGGEAQD